MRAYKLGAVLAFVAMGLCWFRAGMSLVDPSPGYAPLFWVVAGMACLTVATEMVVRMVTRRLS